VPYPFNTRQYARLLILRSRLDADKTLDDRAAASFAEGLSRILSFYEGSGVHPFTFAFFSSPDARSGGFFSLHLRVCARPPFRSLYANYDSWFGPKQLRRSRAVRRTGRWRSITGGKSMGQGAKRGS